MQCFVYKSDTQDNHYLYLASKIDASELNVPDALLSMLGDLSFVVQFDLQPQRVLPGADAKHVIKNIEEQGFFLQLPKENLWAEEEQLFN